MPLGGFRFEVFGRVQGVFFRDSTRKKARELNVVGWVMNTKTSTVRGEAQGDVDKLEIMKEWLSKTGSPMSHIEKCNIEGYSVDKLKFSSFEIVKDPPSS